MFVHYVIDKIFTRKPYYVAGLPSTSFSFNLPLFPPFYSYFELYCHFLCDLFLKLSKCFVLERIAMLALFGLLLAAMIVRILVGREPANWVLLPSYFHVLIILLIFIVLI